MLDYADQLAKKVPPKEDKRGKHRAKPLTPLEISVRDDANRQLKETGRVFYYPLRNTGRDLSNAQVHTILRKLRKKGELDRKTFLRSHAPIIREADENHPLYKGYLPYAMAFARNFSRKNPDIPAEVSESYAKATLLRAAQRYDEKKETTYKWYLAQSLIRVLGRIAKKETMNDMLSMDAPIQNVKKGLHETIYSDKTLHDYLHGENHEETAKGIEQQEYLKNLLDLHKEGKMSENHVLVKILRSEAYRVPLEDAGKLLKLSAERVRQIEEEAKSILDRQKKIKVRRNLKPFLKGRENAEIN